MTAASFVYLPLSTLLLGAIAGLITGRFLTGRWLWVLPILLCLFALVLIVKLAGIQPGAEEAAFGPFVALTGGVFPALLGLVLGLVGGRALRARTDH